MGIKSPVHEAPYRQDIKLESPPGAHGQTPYLVDAELVQFSFNDDQGLVLPSQGVHIVKQGLTPFLPCCDLRECKFKSGYLGTFVWARLEPPKLMFVARTSQVITIFACIHRWNLLQFF